MRFSVAIPYALSDFSRAIKGKSGENVLKSTGKTQRFENIHRNAEGKCRKSSVIVPNFCNRALDIGIAGRYLMSMGVQKV